MLCKVSQGSEVNFYLTNKIIIFYFVLGIIYLPEAILTLNSKENNILYIYTMNEEKNNGNKTQL